jgi:2-oxoisovalerate dehydrogenase E2 component (dihydrolipoyl transacylase)
MVTQTATTITMPKLGESVTDGTVGAWLKQVGEAVEKYEALLEVHNDKVNTEIPSPVAGVLMEILVEPETTVPVGAALCLIDEGRGVDDSMGREGHEPGGGTADERGGAPAERTNGAVSIARPLDDRTRRPSGQIPDELELLRARSSPVVRRIAAEHGVEIGQIAGSGIGGRVTKQDLLAFLASPAATAAPEPEPARPQPAPIAPMPSPPQRPAVPPPVELFAGDEAVPWTPMRRAIAEHMVRSVRTAPQTTCVMEVDMTNVVAYRAARKEDFSRREGVELSYVAFAIKAVTLALRDQPRLNAVWDEEGQRIVHRRAINVGVAVGLEDGLIVPVVRNADRLSLTGLAHAVAELAGKARAGTLTPDDLAGGTFTVNNPGTFGTLVSTPILVQPQVAILSTEAIDKRPVVIDEMIAIRSMMNLSLTIDHRALDGLAAARFLAQVKGWLEGVDEKLGLQ